MAPRARDATVFEADKEIYNETNNKTRELLRRKPGRFKRNRRGSRGDLEIRKKEEEKKIEEERRKSEEQEVMEKRRKSLGGGGGSVPKSGTPETKSTSTAMMKTNKPSSQEKKEDRTLERNIDNVIFGDITFKAWYPSWYPKEIIGEKALSLAEEGKGTGIVVDELFVCRKCFKYTKLAQDWKKHSNNCAKGVPGREIYVHMRGKGKEAGEGRWSVWEVDGAVDKLFCQCLSLFAKLFLDNKSVFFDVDGFNYFLLIHTNLTTRDQQIIGFFSKEKMSWDNNNLACILIFPPWQKKGLGALLIGISYSIARREGILGGPEKPISDLGKKGYKRYWSTEICRWLLEQKEFDKKKNKGAFTVEDVSKATWILPEDCLGVLREMGVCRKLGKGRDGKERVEIERDEVLRWIEGIGLDLKRVVDEEGFVEGYMGKKKIDEGA